MRSVPAAVALVATAAVVVAGCVPDTPVRRLDDCAAAFRAVVETRGRRGSSILGGSTGLVEVRAPVGAVGDWVLLTSAGDVVVVEDGEARAVCKRAGRSSALGGHTRAVGEEATRTRSSGGIFTDSDLRSALASNPRGVALYVWSPHMPLSVDGYAELRAAGDARGIAVIPLLFASSDTAFARREAERVGMPSSALRLVASAELILRDAQLHAPAVVVFRPGRASPVMPGYRDADGYGRWLDAVIAATDVDGSR